MAFYIIIVNFIGILILQHFIMIIINLYHDYMVINQICAGVYWLSS